MPFAPGSGGGDYISNPFKLFGPSWRAVKLNFWTWVLLYLLGVGIIAAEMAVGFAVAFGAQTAHAPSPVIGIAISAVVLTAINIFYLIPRFTGALPVLILASARGTKMSVREALRAGRPFGWRLVGLYLLFLLVILVGYLLLFIPGLIFSVWFGFASLVLVDENLGIVASMKRSKQIVSGRFWEVVGPYGVFSLMSIPSIIPFIGVLITLVLEIPYYFAPTIRYVQLKDYKDHGRPFPPVSGVNYFLPIAMVVISILSFVVFGFAAINSLRNHSTVQSQPGSVQFNTKY